MTDFPPPVARLLQANPLISNWLAFEGDKVRTRSGRVELGQGVDLALRRIAADALSVSLDQIDPVAGDTRECPDEGYTAGSMSIEHGGVTLRAACAAARKLLLARARELLQAPDADLAVTGGAIARDGTDTGLTWWKLAADVDLDRPVADIVGPEALGPPATTADLTEHAGSRIRARLSGGAFIHDLELPGMLHARTICLPHPQARLTSIDATTLAPAILHRDGSFLAVLAETETQALAAADRAERLAQWTIPDPGNPTPFDLLETAGEPDTMTHHGTPAEGTETTASVSRPFLAHASIGTCCALAEWRGNRLRVWSHAQGPHPLRAGLALALDLPEDAIEVIHRPGAGCYGHNGADDAAFEAALLARANPGRPIRLVWSRRAELTRASLAPAMTTETTITLHQGTIAGIALDILSAPHQRRPGPGKPNFAAGPLLADPVPLAAPAEPPPQNGGGADRNSVPLYRTPAILVRRRLATEIPVRTSAMRALGATINVASTELAIDAAADAAGTDPVAFRRAHLDDPRALAVLDRVADLSGFTAETTETRAMGLALARYKLKAGYCAIALELLAADTLRVTRLWAVADVGEAIDPLGAIAQIEGGAIQALSWCLKEEMPLDRGAPAAPDWESYPILRFSEIPETQVDLIPHPSAPLGAGEISSGPTAGALACAARRILGLERIAFPLTPDNIARQLLA